MRLVQITVTTSILTIAVDRPPIGYQSPESRLQNWVLGIILSVFLFVVYGLRTHIVDESVDCQDGVDAEPPEDAERQLVCRRWPTGCSRWQNARVPPWMFVLKAGNLITRNRTVKPLMDPPTLVCHESRDTVKSAEVKMERSSINPRRQTMRCLQE